MYNSLPILIIIYNKSLCIVTRSRQDFIVTQNRRVFTTNFCRASEEVKIGFDCCHHIYQRCQSFDWPGWPSERVRGTKQCGKRRLKWGSLLTANERYFAEVQVEGVVLMTKDEL